MKSRPPKREFPAPKFNLPPRPKNVLNGSEFFLKMQSLPRDEREAAVFKQISGGNIPQFLRSLKQIDVEATDSNGVKHTASYFVTPDYLAVGDETDFFRMPMTPMTAQKIAAATDASLITTKISDDILSQAELKLQPQPLIKNRESAGTFFEHHNLIENQRSKPLGQLIAGIKKASSSPTASRKNRTASPSTAGITPTASRYNRSTSATSIGTSITATASV